MGAYENPNINVGVDTKSGLIRAQGIQGFAEGIAKGVSAYGSAMSKQRIAAQKNQAAYEKGLQANNKEAAGYVKSSQDAVHEDNTNNVTATPFAKALGDFAQNDLAKWIGLSKKNDNQGKYFGGLVEQSKADLGRIPGVIGDLDLVTKGFATGGYDSMYSTAQISQVSSGSNTTTSSKMFYDEATKKNKAVISWQSDTIKEQNKLLGAKGDTFSLNILELGPMNTNPFIDGWVNADYYGTRPYEINKTITEEIRKSPSIKTYSKGGVTTKVDGTFNKTIQTQYVDADALVLSATSYADAEAKSLLSLENGNFPANAYYNTLLKRGELQKRDDGSFFMMVPGEKTGDDKNLFLTNEQLRNEDGTLKTSTVELDIPYIEIDAEGKDSVKTGNNLFTKEGFDGLVNVIKYQKLKQENWTETKEKEISKVSNTGDKITANKQLELATTQKRLDNLVVMFDELDPKRGFSKIENKRKDVTFNSEFQREINRFGFSFSKPPSENEESEFVILKSDKTAKTKELPSKGLSDLELKQQMYLLDGGKLTDSAYKKLKGPAAKENPYNVFKRN
jgi:hypothetical protein